MKTSNFYLFLFTLLILSSCGGPDKEAYKRDPIYLDLLGDLDKTTKEIEAKEKEKESFHSILDDPKSPFYDKADARKNILTIQKEISKLTQKKKFYEISIESRALYSKKEYLDYYERGQDWPPKDKINIYIEGKNAVNNFDHRWKRGLASQNMNTKEEKKPSH